MKLLFKLTMCFSILLISNFSKADEDDEAKEKAEKQHLRDSAIDLDGFKISNAGQKRFGLKMILAKGDFLNLEIPHASLVYHQNSVGIYRVRKESFKLLEVKILNKTDDTTKVKCEELLTGDFIVTEGAALVRVAEIAEKSGIEGEGL